MDIAQTAVGYMIPVSDAFVYITTTKVHEVWFPFLLAPTLHAARVSMAFQYNARRSQKPLSWGEYIAGYLIMCWGGTLVSNLMLGLPPPMLFSFKPVIIYTTTHLFLTLVFNVFPSLLNPPVLNTILWPVDALLRTNSVTSTLNLLSSPNVHPEYRNSALTHLILGVIASSGGGISAGTIGGWSSNWMFGTPPFLRAGAGWTGTLDVWGGALVALIYSSTTGHPAFSSLHTYVTLALSSPPLTMTRKPQADTNFPPLDPLGARSLAATVLGLLFAARVITMHWLPSIADSTIARPAAVASSTKKGKKKTA